MVKVKNRQTGPIPTKKGKALSSLMGSSNDGIEGDLNEDDEWVIVKKQKVTILVPPPALPIQTKHQVLRTHKVSNSSKKTINPQKYSGGDSKCLFDKRSLATAHNLTKNNTSTVFKTAPNGLNCLIGESVAPRSSLNYVYDHRSPRGHEPSKAFRVSGAPKDVKMPAAPRPTRHQGPTLFLRPISCLNVAALQNRMMRASNLERKLEKSGGLSRWLISLGLGKFVKMFHRKNVDKFQLLNLTMEKLRDMGANAVGPRRKLIHAIDCLSQPYCFNKH